MVWPRAPRAGLPAPMELAAFLSTSLWRPAILVLLPTMAVSAVTIPSAGEPTAYEATTRFAVRPAVGASTEVTNGQVAERVAKAVRDPRVQEASASPVGPAAQASGARVGGVVTVRVTSTVSADHAHRAAVALGSRGIAEVYRDERDGAVAKVAELDTAVASSQQSLAALIEDAGVGGGTARFEELVGGLAAARGARDQSRVRGDEEAVARWQRAIDDATAELGRLEAALPEIRRAEADLRRQQERRDEGAARLAEIDRRQDELTAGVEAGAARAHAVPLLAVVGRRALAAAGAGLLVAASGIWFVAALGRVRAGRASRRRRRARPTPRALVVGEPAARSDLVVDLHSTSDDEDQVVVAAAEASA